MSMEEIFNHCSSIETVANHRYPNHKFSALLVNDNYLLDTYNIYIDGAFLMSITFLGDPNNLSVYFYEKLDKHIKLHKLDTLTNKL